MTDIFFLSGGIYGTNTILKLYFASNLFSWYCKLFGNYKVKQFIISGTDIIFNLIILPSIYDLLQTLTKSLL